MSAQLSAAAAPPAGNLSLMELIDAASRYTTSNQVEPACQLYRDWIDSHSEHPLLYVAHFNCSALETQIGDTQAAMESLRKSIKLNADFMPAYINLGGALERSGAPAEAIELWRSALSRPTPINGSAVTYAGTALRQMARVLSDHQQAEYAETAVQLCIDINPHQHDVIEQYIALRLAQCKWPVAVGRESIDRKTLVRGIHPLSVAVYTDDPLWQLAAADRYARITDDKAPISRAFDRRNAPIDTKRRLRIGYVSSDLRDHAIGYLMAEFFELHDRKAVEVFAYYCGIPSTSELTNRIQSAVEHWTDIRGMSDDDAARKIAEDGIDILVDVNGHTRDSRTGVFARRPAPVQVNWLGYPGSMGTPYHQYIIADDWIIPPGSEMYYSEKVLRLPCYQPNDRKRVVAETPRRSDVGLPEDAFVFCCFNGTHKIARFTFERWMQIMNKVPNSVLWLLEATPETHTRLGDYAEGMGISRTRLVFAPKRPNALHLARYKLADLFLDTVPYGAHTTASDALWMGIPVLTLSGRSFASRVCGSLVRSAGLPKLVCTRPEDFVAKGIALGNNRAEVESLKRKLEANRSRSTLFDMETLVARIEDLYKGMAREHKAGRTPQPQLTNLETYLDIASGFDHEAVEMLTVPDYIGFYKAKLVDKHLFRSLTPDGRLWTAKDVAAVERAFQSPQRKRSAAKPRRRTGRK